MLPIHIKPPVDTHRRGLGGLSLNRTRPVPLFPALALILTTLVALPAALGPAVMAASSTGPAVMAASGVGPAAPGIDLAAGSGSTGGEGPRDLRARAGSAAVRLTWEPPAAPPAPVVTYAIYRDPATATATGGPGGAPSGGAPVTAPIAVVPAQATEYVDYGVLTGRTYAYTVRARLAGKREGPAAGPVSATPHSADLSIALRLGQGTVLVNGLETALDAPAELIKGVTMVPLRFIGSALGATVDYAASDKRVTATLGLRTIRLWVGKTKAEIDGRPATVSAAPVLVRGHTLVPVRFIAEAFGAAVGYEPKTGRISVAMADSDATVDRATAIEVGAPQGSALAGSGDIDFYRCPVSGGKTYRVSLSGLGSGTDPVLAVVDPDLDPGAAVEIAAGGWPLGGRPPDLEVASGPTQTVLYLRVQSADPDAGGGGGAYTITVEDRTEPQDNLAGAVALTVASGGVLHAASDVDYFSFPAEAGRSYAVSVEASGGSRPGDMAVELLDPAGRTLMKGDTSNDSGAAVDSGGVAGAGAAGGGAPPVIVWEGQESGLYYLAVSSLAGGYGPYSISVEPVAPEANDNLRGALALAPDHDARVGWLSSASDRDWYSFTVTGGRRYYVQTSTGAGGASAALSLFSWDETPLAAGEDAPGLGFPGGGFLATYTATYDGLIYARVSAGAAEPWDPVPTGLGRYTISATTTHPEDDDYLYLATPLAAGAPPLFRSLVDGDRDWFAAAVTGGLTYTLATADLSPGCDTDVAVYDEAWNLVAANDDAGGGSPASRVTWTAEASGAIYVCVSPVYLDDYRDGTGTYSVAFGAPGHADEP